MSRSMTKLEIDLRRNDRRCILNGDYFIKYSHSIEENQLKVTGKYINQHFFYYGMPVEKAVKKYNNLKYDESDITMVKKGIFSKNKVPYFYNVTLFYDGVEFELWSNNWEVFFIDE